MERPENLLEVACEAARLGGAVLEGRFGGTFEIKKKGTAIDLVTEMDLKSERVIVDYICRNFPAHAILAEENAYGDAASKGSTYKWIIDPLDGTTNYAHGYPIYSVSIAVEVEGIVTAGVVYHPPLKEMFTAIQGEGAKLNGKEVRVSAVDDLGESLTVTGFPYDVRTPPHRNVEHFTRFLKSARAVRRDGSAALDLAYVAAGRFDGYWEPNLSPWDVAAGSLMVREAGGTVSDYRGTQSSIYDKQFVASNGKIHGQMLRLLAD